MRLLLWSWMGLLTALPGGTAKERSADLWEAVGDSEYAVVGTVEEVPEALTVVLAVHSWLKGKPTADGRISLTGETGHCVLHGPVSQFMPKGGRFLVFVFPGGKPGRLGHIQQIGPDGSFPRGGPSFLYAGPEVPKTEADLAARVRHLQTPEFVKEEVAKFGSSDPERAREAVRRVGAARAPAAFDPLLALSRDVKADRALRAAAILALGRLRDARALEPLAEILSQNPDGLGYPAAMALGELGDRRAVPEFAGRLDESYATKRRLSTLFFILAGASLVLIWLLWYFARRGKPKPAGEPPPQPPTLTP